MERPKSSGLTELSFFWHRKASAPGCLTPWFRVQKPLWVYDLCIIYAQWSAFISPNNPGTLNSITLKQEGPPRESRWQYPLQGNAQQCLRSQPAPRSLSFHPGTKLVPLMSGEEKTICTTPLQEAYHIIAPRCLSTVNFCEFRQSTEELKHCSKTGCSLPSLLVLSWKSNATFSVYVGNSWSPQVAIQTDLLSQPCHLLPHTPVTNLMTLNSSESVLATRRGSSASNTTNETFPLWIFSWLIKLISPCSFPLNGNPNVISLCFLLLQEL